MRALATVLLGALARVPRGRVDFLPAHWKRVARMEVTDQFLNALTG